MKSINVGVRTVLLGLLVVAASFIPRRAAANDDVTSPRNADVSASGAKSVRIEAAGGILRVEGRSGINEVRIRGTARADRTSRLDAIKLIAERRGDEVFIKADMPEWRDRDWHDRDHEFVALDLVIEVPSSLKLDVSDGSGEAEFNNTGSIELGDGSGEIKIRNARGDVRVSDGSGSIIIEGVEGSVRVNDGSGSISARNVTGNFVVTTDGSGNIDVERVTGDFVVENDGSGGISYDTVKGSVRIPERKRRS